MIDRVVVENFQSHAKLSLEISPGVTVLVGPSDRGKSAVLRALRWLALNTPSGAEFIRRGEDECRAAARVDGVWVQRRRAAKENVYQVGQEPPHQLERGGSVPTAVAALFNLGPGNFSGQHDPPFWLADTAGRVAQQLNEIVDLSQIDDVLGRAAAGVRDARAAARAAGADLADAERDLAALPDPAPLEAALGEVSSTAEKLSAFRQSVKWLRDLITAAEAPELLIREYEKVIKVGQTAIALCTEVRTKQASLRAVQRAVQLAEAQPPPFPEAAWDALLAAREKLTTVSDRRGALEDVLTDLAEVEGRMWREQKATEAAEKMLEVTATTLPPTCPTCGQATTPSQYLSVIRT